MAAVNDALQGQDRVGGAAGQQRPRARAPEPPGQRHRRAHRLAGRSATSGIGWLRAGPAAPGRRPAGRGGRAGTAAAGGGTRRASGRVQPGGGVVQRPRSSTAGPSSSGWATEAGGRDPAQAVLGQRQAAEPGRQDAQRVHRRAQVVLEPGQGHARRCACRRRSRSRASSTSTAAPACARRTAAASPFGPEPTTTTSGDCTLDRHMYRILAGHAPESLPGGSLPGDDGQGPGARPLHDVHEPDDRAVVGVVVDIEDHQLAGVPGQPRPHDLT